MKKLSTRDVLPPHLLGQETELGHQIPEAHLEETEPLDQFEAVDMLLPSPSITSKPLSK
jgi:hypothetical protein